MITVAKRDHETKFDREAELRENLHHWERALAAYERRHSMEKKLNATMKAMAGRRMMADDKLGGAAEMNLHKASSVNLNLYLVGPPPSVVPVFQA